MCLCQNVDPDSADKKGQEIKSSAENPNKLTQSGPRVREK